MALFAIFRSYCQCVQEQKSCALVLLPVLLSLHSCTNSAVSKEHFMSVLHVRLDIAVQYHSVRTQSDFSNPEWNRYCVLPAGIISARSKQVINCALSPVNFGRFLCHG